MHVRLHVGKNLGKYDKPTLTKEIVLLQLYWFLFKSSKSDN